MKHLRFFATACVALAATLSAAIGCGGNSGSGTGGGGHTTTTSTGGHTSSGNPAPPTIGAQIDRMGRPAINTALNHSFDGNMTTAGAAKDTYNQDSDPTKWSGSYAAEMAKNLAILDALDGTCGNQLLAGAMATATRYSTLAGALSDDRLWLNTAGSTCTTYLAVEANAVGVKANMDCGGRALGYDVIDVTYSAVAAGMFSGVSDGVDMNDATFSTTFPYLAAPH